MTAPAIVATTHTSREDGPLLVLGPSLGSDCAILWELVIPLLRDRYRIVSWDLPGHGRSPATAEPFTVGELADSVAALAAGLTDEPALYAGVSIGGATGLELALHHADQFRAVALVCSSYRLGGAGWPQTWHDRAELVRTQSTSALIGASAERWFTPASITEHPETTGRLLHALQDADDATYMLCCEALAAFDLEDRLGEIAIPVLNLYGERDATIDRTDAERLVAVVPDARLVLIPEAAHLGTVDQPVLVADALREFFA
jgi:3-oxoadipate enol-lactonase